MADKYVKLDDVIDTLENEWGYEGMREDLDNLSAADVAPVAHGEWKFEHDPINDPKRLFIRIVCSCCGLKTGQVSNYCPNCGAKMDGGKHETD